MNVIVPATHQAGNMLVAYLNNLCGGVGNVDLPVELYQRWVQFSSFSPIIWFHGVWDLRLPWEYGPEGIETYRKFVGLRYALIPYTYTYARIAHKTGLPLVRGMYLKYPDQEPAYTHPHQFMFGKELLVAPVTQAAFDKPALKEVFLPAGADWFDYFTGDIYRGGQTITCIEVYQKEKTIKENLCPDKPVGCGAGDFAGWGGIGPVANLIEYVLGFDINVPQKRVVWRITRTEKHGLKNLHLGPFAVDLLCEHRENAADPCRLTLTSGGDFTLVIFAGARRLETQITQGPHQLVVE